MHGSPQHPRRANGLLELGSPGHVNEDERDGVKDGDEDRKRDREADKVQVKVQGHLSP